MSSFKEIYKRETITDRSYVFQFGRYKGNTLEFVLDTDPQYLLFCQSKIDWFDLHHTILDEIDRTEDERYNDGFKYDEEVWPIL